MRNDREWLAIMRALDQPQWEEGPRFLTAELRQQNIFCPARSHPVRHQDGLRRALARAPARFSGQSEHPWQSAPGLGQNTVDLLAECGYSAQEAQEMIDSGVAGVGN